MEPQSSLNRFNYLLGETEALYHDLAQALGLSDSAMRILYALCDGGDPSPLREILRRSGLSKQTANSALRKLEAQGLVYLETMPGRGKQLCLTPAGRELADRTAMRVIGMENRVFGGWQPGEVQQYLALTERFLEDMRQQAADLVPLPGEGRRK